MHLIGLLFVHTSQYDGAYFGLLLCCQHSVTSAFGLMTDQLYVTPHHAYSCSTLYPIGEFWGSTVPSLMVCEPDVRCRPCTPAGKIFRETVRIVDSGRLRHCMTAMPDTVTGRNSKHSNLSPLQAKLPETDQQRKQFWELPILRSFLL
jgi:hypothetical protein